MAVRELKLAGRSGNPLSRRAAGVIAVAVISTAAAGFFFSAGAAALWAIGLGLGYALQRARLCFAGTFRDFFLFRDTGPLRGFLVLLFLSTIGFAAVQYVAPRVPGSAAFPPGYFAPFGLSTVVGAFLFGIGMVLAAGCASGTLTRLGEGFGYAFFALLGMGAGSAVGVYQSPAWASWDEALGLVHAPVFLGDSIDWPVALLLQLGLLAALFRFTGGKKG